MRPQATRRLALALLLAGSPLAAQAPALPVHGGPLLPGLEAAAVVSFNDDDLPEWSGTAFGASLGWGTRRVGLSGTVGVFSPEQGRDRMTGGLLGTIRLLGGGVTTPLTVGAFAGVGWMAESDLLEDEVRHVPIGGTAALTLATPVVSIRPWLAPRLDLQWCDPPGTQDVASICYGEESRFGLSGGIDLRFPGGVSLRLLSDYVDGGAPSIALGAGYSF